VGWAPSANQGTGGSTKRVVLGYYVPYDPTSWASFQAHAADLDYVDAQWVTVDGCGNLGSRDDRTLIAFAGQHGVKVLPSLLTSSGWLNHRLLTDPATTDHFVKQIVSYVVDMGYPGIDLDMEGINAEDRDAYSALVAAVADALHQRDKILTLAIPAKSSDVRTGWAGPYDYAALGKQADLILLMTYDYSWSTSPPGSIAPQAWVDRVATYAVSQIPSDKLLIGLAFYGYDWNTTLGGKARALQYPQAAALASQHGTRIATDATTSSGTFSYTAAAGEIPPPTPPVPTIQHDKVVRTPAPCSVQAPPTLPPPTPTPGPPPKPRPTVPPSAVQQHVVWLEDAASAAARACRPALRGRNLNRRRPQRPPPQGTSCDRPCPCPSPSDPA
ncbi:MAG: glycosyl hydrolase family 18 protein, partial [Acidobacteria bacterium]|nr:glycosyl hydrolase family 18 protein [Acidobacteriota bacterium]